MKKYYLLAMFLLIGLPSISHAWLSGYTNFANVSVNGAVNDSFFLNLSTVGVTCGTPKCMEVVVTNTADGVLPYQTAINGLWYGRTAAGENISGSYPKDNITAIFLNETAANVYVYYNNNTEQIDKSVSLLLWDDNFQEYAIGTAASSVAKFFSNNGGSATVDNSGGTTRHVLGMNGGGFTMAWNVTEFKNVTVIWEINNSASATNDQGFFTFSTTYDNGYRSPQTFPDNVWGVRVSGSGIGTTLSYTGATNTGINISFQREGTFVNLYLRNQTRLMKGGNVSNTAITQGSIFGFVPGLVRKGLYRITAWNLTVNPAFSPAITYTTNTLAPANSCTPSSPVWTLNLADNCTLSGVYSVTNWTIYSTGRGTTITDNFTLTFTNRIYGSFVEFAYFILFKNASLIRK